MNPPVKRDLAAYLGIAESDIDPFLRSRADLRGVMPAYIGPADRCVTHADGSHIDEWGVTRRPVSYGSGHYDEIFHYPLADITDAAQLDDVTFPSPDWYDYSSLHALIDEANRDAERAIILFGANPFERAWAMRGLETMLADLIVEKEIAHGILERATDFFVEYITRSLEEARGKIDIVFTADDIGGQEGLLLSLPLWEEMFKPYHARLNQVIHSFGAKVMYHSDGAIMDVLEGLVDMGIDILEALQFNARGMDPVAMKNRVGDKISFHGGISVQSTLPFGTPEDVEREVRERIEVLGRGGGYICAPSHTIQAGTPVENVVAFLKAVGRY